ncbi:ABC transporter permease [Leifsonia sp. AG29]|uniref:ABC transporter permease n=1 Tax=Leifsonia sp. AG29 TaxID=2598860 RepID=UPI0018EEDCA5|nr:hypothetical protein [Leifsonia sp. AG29]
MSAPTDTTTAPRPPETRHRGHAGDAPSRPAGRGHLLAVLVRQRLRRDRWQLLTWILSIGLLAAFSGAAILQTYASEAGRLEVMRLAIANPTILMLRGIPQGTSIAALTFFEIYTFNAVLAGLMNTFLAVRHSRAEEETGRAELVGSTPAGRLLPTTATVIHGLIANVLLALATALGFMAAGLPAYGSLVAGVATGGAGVAFLAVGLVMAQFMTTSRGANGYAAAIVMLAYLLRGIGDATGTVFGDGTHMHPGWASWLSPIGWGQQFAPYTANDWRPLLLQLGFAALLLGVVFALQAVRDSGAGIVGQRAGRPAARPTLNGPLGLAWRLQWPTILGWVIGGALTGALAGALGSAVNTSIVNDPSLKSIREAVARIGSGGTGSFTQLFISAIFTIVGVLAAACAVQAVIRLRQEEASGSAEVMMSTPLSRVRWLLEFLLVGVIAIVLVLLAAAITSGLSAVAAGDDNARIGDSFTAASAQLPVALVYLGVLALVFVVAPSWTVPVGWAGLGLGAFVGVFGALVNLPDWMRHTSPFADAPVVVGTPDWTGGYWMFGITVVSIAAAAVLIRRRDFAIG